ncbi:MAG: hypothetical protein AAFO62_04515 [Pseudomonadota bacterium]
MTAQTNTALRGITTWVATVGIAAAAITGAAQAETTEDCLKQTFEVIAPIQKTPPAEDKLATIEKQMEKVEAHCDAKQFDQAATERTVLKDMIAKL